MTSSKITQNSSFDLSWLASYRRITVIGLGMSGIGVIRKFAEHNIHVHVQDSRENPTGLVDIEGLENVQTVVLGSFDKHGIMASDLLVVSPGVSLKTPEIQAAIEAGIEITGDIDIVSKSTNIPLLTITGSNGKSTVTQLAGEICLAAGYETFIGGNIGRSAMELLSKEESFDIAVLELSLIHI